MTISETPPPDRTRLMLDSYVKLMRAAESVTARAHRLLGSYGLTITQFAVLEVLHHRGPLCQRDIGRKILKSSGNITTVIDNLVRRELVERRTDPADRRYVQVHLTPVGASLIAHLFPRQAAEISREMSRLDDAELEELGRLCRKLGRGDD